jgi:hypothetical protein
VKLVVCSWCDGDGDAVCPQCFGECVYHLDDDKVKDHSVVPCDCHLCCTHTNVTEAGQCAACKAWLTLTSVPCFTNDAEVLQMKYLRCALNWFFPIYTHCTSCGMKLPEGDRNGVCEDCRAW